MNGRRNGLWTPQDSLLLGQEPLKLEACASEISIMVLRLWRFKSLAYFPTLPLYHLTDGETDPLHASQEIVSAIFWACSVV